MTTDLYPKVRRAGGGRRQHRGHRQGRRHDRAEHGHHAGLPADRPAGAARRRCARLLRRGGRPQLQPHQHRQRHQHLGHGGAAVLGRRPLPRPGALRRRAGHGVRRPGRGRGPQRRGRPPRHPGAGAAARPSERGGPGRGQGRGQLAAGQDRHLRQRPQRRPHRRRPSASRSARTPRPGPRGLRLRLGGHDLFHGGAFRLVPARRSRPGRPPARRRAVRQRRLPPTACSSPRWTTPRTSARWSSEIDLGAGTGDASTGARRRPHATSTSARTPTTAAEPTLRAERGRRPVAATSGRT